MSKVQYSSREDKWVKRFWDYYDKGTVSMADIILMVRKGERVWKRERIESAKVVGFTGRVGDVNQSFTNKYN